MFVNGGCRPSAHAVILWTSVTDTVVNYLKGGRDAAKLSNRARYIAPRPGPACRRGEHGLRCADRKVRDLSQAVREVAEHTGSVWTPPAVFSSSSITWAVSFGSSPPPTPSRPA